MQLSSEQLLPVAQSVAWGALNDTEILKAAIPGCESIIAVAENEFEIRLTAAIGPVKAKFSGRLRLADVTPPESYTMHFQGHGGAAGFAKGSASVRLEQAGAGATRLVYSVDAQVGGKIAQIGSRIVDMAAQKLSGEFFRALTAELEQRYAGRGSALPHARNGEAPGGWWPRASAFFARLLRRLRGGS